MLSESQKLSTYYVAFWTGFVFGHPLCEGSASVTTDDPVLVACVTKIERNDRTVCVCVCVCVCAQWEVLFLLKGQTSTQCGERSRVGENFGD